MVKRPEEIIDRDMKVQDEKIRSEAGFDVLCHSARAESVCGANEDIIFVVMLEERTG